MHFLAVHLEKKVKEIADFPAELTHVGGGARGKLRHLFMCIALFLIYTIVSKKHLASDFKTLGKDLNEVDKMMNNIGKDKFSELLNEFLFVAKEDFKVMSNEFQEIENDVRITHTAFISPLIYLHVVQKACRLVW